MARPLLLLLVLLLLVLLLLALLLLPIPLLPSLLLLLLLLAGSAANQTFETFWQFLVALLTLPLALTLAEAFSPHTMDTPFIMGIGGAILYAIITLL